MPVMFTKWKFTNQSNFPAHATLYLDTVPITTIGPVPPLQPITVTLPGYPDKRLVQVIVTAPFGAAGEDECPPAYYALEADSTYYGFYVDVKAKCTNVATPVPRPQRPAARNSRRTTRGKK